MDIFSIMQHHIAKVPTTKDGRQSDINGDIRRTQVRFSFNIKSYGMICVNLIFKLLKRRSQFKGELLQKDFTESEVQEVIIKMCLGSPGSKVASAAFRN